MEQAIIDEILEEKAPGGHKGDYGRISVIGGSGTYTNTPAIVALGALRAGCDLTNIVAPEQSAQQCAGFALNIMTTALDGDHLQEQHVKTLVDRTEWADCVVVGPGLGRQEETVNAVKRYLEVNTEASVIDADALHVLAEHTGFAESEWVLTPHAREFEALTGEYPPGNIEERIELVEDYAGVFGCTILLKGETDVISDGDRTETNDTGNPYMTRGGTGDTLAGLTAALLSLQYDPFESACAAAYFNGAAGDEALGTYGRGFLLEEMLDCVSAVMSPELGEAYE